MSEPRIELRAIGELPLVRRLHQALAVGLAVFMLTLVVLREPFQGYLAEVHISGPSTAGLDLDEAVQWLRSVEPHLAAVATPAGEISAKCEIRATYVAPHPKQAISHLDELADRWLYQYLPDRLQTYRRGTLASLRSALNKARQLEDSLQERVEALRQRQVAELRGQDSGARSQEQGNRVQETADRRQGAGNASSMTSENSTESGNKLRERLEGLRVQLSHLLGSHTDEHPEIVTLKSQINSLERQLATPDASLPDPDGGQSIQQAGGRQTAITASPEVRPASGELRIETRGSAAEVELAAEISTVMSELTKVSRQRQAAEQHLADRMQELSNGPTAAQWSAGPAHVVTRLGGTPRSLTLAVAGVLACIGAIAMFRVTAIEMIKPKIASANELAEAMKVPVVGDLAKGGNSRGGHSPPYGWLTPRRLRVVTTLAESFVAVAAGACLISVAIDPTLAREVLADPFGTLSEVMGRFGA